MKISKIIAVFMNGRHWNRIKYAFLRILCCVTINGHIFRIIILGNFSVTIPEKEIGELFENGHL
jgi:hypothetical protein